jgi:hypothetical protein
MAKKLPESARKILEDATDEAAQALVACLRATKPIITDRGEGMDIPDLDMRLKAAQVLYDRVYGRPVQSVGGVDGEPVRVDIASIGESLKRLAGGK